MLVGGPGVRGQLVVVFRNKGCFLWLDAAAWGGARKLCVCLNVYVCDWAKSNSSIVVLSFTNDLTMPPGAGAAPVSHLSFSSC